MNQNIGETEQVFRIFIGMAIIVSGIYFDSFLGLIGFLPVITAITGSCPLYTLLGISTAEPRETEPES
jgi:hypothetical protein